MTETGSIKLVVLWNSTNAAQVDICAITKCNINWKHTPAYLHPKEQMRYWWESSHWSITNNTQETNEVTYQPGGAALIIINQLLHRSQRPGNDKVGLG